MQQLLNLTESADNFARLGKGKDLSLKGVESDNGEFSRLMLKQNSGDKELQQLAARIEAHQSAKGEAKAGDFERKNIGEPVTRNLWELLQQMQEQSADIHAEGETASTEETSVASDAKAFELGDEKLSDMIQALLAKLDSASAESEDAVMTDAERQKFADQLLADMSNSDKQALQSKLEQMIQAVEQGENAAEAVEEAGQFIVHLLEPALPKADAEKLLAGNENTLTQALNEAAGQVIAQLSGEKPTPKPQNADDLVALLNQLEKQISAQKARGEHSELSLGEQKRLQQLTAELRQILGSQNSDAGKSQLLSKEQSAKAEQLLAEVKQLLKTHAGHSEKSTEQAKAAEPVIAATNNKAGKEKADMGDSEAKADLAPKSGENKPQLAAQADSNSSADVDAQLSGQGQQSQTLQSSSATLTDANIARAIQGQTVSTSQGTVAANESSQANTLQALQRPLDLQQTEASQKLQERINIMMSRNIQRADIRLDPPELGSVQIRVNMSGEQASVQFQVQSAQAKDAIETAMPRLREMLEQQGINLADTQVGEQSKNGERTAGGQSGSSEESEDWAIESEIALDNGQVVADGQVDFYV